MVKITDYLRRYLIVMILGALVVSVSFLSGCGREDNSTITVKSTQSQSKDKKDDSSNDGLVAKKNKATELKDKKSSNQRRAGQHPYERILDNANSYTYWDNQQPDGIVGDEYALLDLNGDGYKDMIIAKDVGNGLQGVRSFAWDPSRGKMIEPDGLFLIGVAGAGGYRGSVAGTNKGIMFSSWHSASGKGFSEHWVLSGGQLVKKRRWETDNIIDNFPAEIKAMTKDLKWYKLSDRSPIQALP